MLRQGGVMVCEKELRGGSLDMLPAACSQAVQLLEVSVDDVVCGILLSQRYPPTEDVPYHRVGPVRGRHGRSARGGCEM